jgi:hypothetical protein
VSERPLRLPAVLQNHLVRPILLALRPRDLLALIADKNKHSLAVMVDTIMGANPASPRCGSTKMLRHSGRGH